MADILYYVLQNTLILKPSNCKWCHDEVTTKNNNKIRTSKKLEKLYIIRKVLITAIQ